MDNVDGIVVDFVVMKGNPPDGPLLAPAVARVKARFAKVPKAVAADRGYGEAKVDADLAALGVKTIAIPRKGRPGAARQAIERGRRFRRLVKWRTGSEGRVACLKRDAGLARTLMDGLGGTQTWCGWGILTQNSIKIARLIDTAAPSASVGRTRPPATAGASPPTPRSDISRPAA